MKEDFAIIIGINDYTPESQSGLRTLSGAVADAQEMKKWLTDPKGGNVPTENCYIITSSPAPLQPLQHEIDNRITEMIAKVRQNGGKGKRLYFYFSGHGLGSMDDIADTALCLANWSEIRRNAALSSETYKNVIQQFGLFEEILFFADCCRNTKINIKPAHPDFAPPMPDLDAGKTELFVAYATQYQDQSYEIEVGDSEKRGVFTKVLLTALKGAAVDENGEVIADRLRDYLKQETPVEALKQNFKQTPEILHTFSTSKPLFVLPDLKNKKFNVRIDFRADRNSVVDLIFPDAHMIQIDSAQEKTKELRLETGLHLLRDTASNETLPLIVLPTKELQHVNF